ncbi:MAG: putative coiled-coil protein SlyX [Gammaproteobacteria bacterium]|jgi:uncharacterized coiled-coil protein SlyX
MAKTTETNDTVTEIPKKIAESAEQLLERMTARQERAVEVIGTTRARNTRISEQIFNAVIAGQREALSLGKTIAAEPMAYNKNMGAIVNSMAAAQERAMEVSKTVIREQSEAFAETRAASEQALSGMKALMQPFEKMTSMWSPAAK